MTAPLLEVENVVKHFVARRSFTGRPTSTVRAVDGITFAIEAGTTLALVGESGCGKSTLGRLVLRLIEPTAGQIRFEGRDISAFNERDLRAFRRSAQIVF
jgi:peptide/nickel transport system ATP-binding protein/oligopeptide transport system ATP-binding protein